MDLIPQEDGGEAGAEDIKEGYCITRIRLQKGDNSCSNVVRGLFVLQMMTVYFLSRSCSD